MSNSSLGNAIKYLSQHMGLQDINIEISIRSLTLVCQFNFVTLEGTLHLCGDYVVGLTYLNHTY